MTIVERVFICFRYAWCWSGFWRGWWNTLVTTFACLWLGLAAVFAVLLQVVSFCGFPVWRLLIEPIKIGLTCTDTQAKNLKNIHPG